VAFADPVTLPYNVVLSTDKADRATITIDFDTNQSVLKYEVWNNDRTEVLKTFTFTLDSAETVALFGGAANANTFKANCSTAMNNDLQDKVQTEAK
jgi:hypothetical protein